MTQDSEPSQEVIPAPAARQSVRDRQMRVGGNLAATAYNRLVGLLQDEGAQLTAEQLVRMIDIGARIEAGAYAELPAESSADADLRRLVDQMGLTVSD